MKKWTLGTKLIQEATETDIDKALEKNTTQSCGKRFYKQPKFLFYMRFFVCLFFKDPNKTTKLPEFVWILALPLTGFPFRVEDLCSLSGNHGVPTEGGSGPLGAAPPCPSPGPLHQPSLPSTYPGLAPLVCPSCTRALAGSPHWTPRSSGMGLNDWTNTGHSKTANWMLKWSRC